MALRAAAKLPPIWFLAIIFSFFKTINSLVALSDSSTHSPSPSLSFPRSRRIEPANGGTHTDRAALSANPLTGVLDLLAGAPDLLAGAPDLGGAPRDPVVYKRRQCRGMQPRTSTSMVFQLWCRSVESYSISN